MSGVEALAVVSIIANIVAVVDFSVEVIDRAKRFGGDVKDVPEEFREVRRTLPLIASTLQKTSTSTKSGQVDEATCKVLRPVLEGCQTKIDELSDIFKKVLPPEGASKWTRGWKAVSSMGQDKKVKALASNIWDDIQALTYYHVSEVATAAQLTTAISAMTVSPPPKKTQFMLRYQKDEDFIGRGQIMEEVEARFKTMNRVAIAGIGGVGKSRIAIEYCYQFKNANPSAHVLWIHGGNRARFESGYEEIARIFEIPDLHDPKIDTLQAISNWLSDEDNGPWLMVLDNADDADLWVQTSLTAGPRQDSGLKPLPLVNYLPRGLHGFILVTTRDLQLGRQLAGTKKKPITVLPLGNEEAELLLYSKISEDDEITPADADHLVTALDCLPLAITQAAAFLDQMEMTVAEYLELLRAGKADTFELLKTSVHDPSRDHDLQNSVFHTWKISFDQILKQDPRAAELLSLMSMLDRQAIPTFLLQQNGESDLQFLASIRRLKAFSLINEELRSSVFSMHRLVQCSVQKWLENQNSTCIWLEAAMSTVSNKSPDLEGRENWPQWRQLLPHIQSLFNQTSDEILPLQRACLLLKVGKYHLERKLLDKSFDEIHEAFQIQERNLGFEHPTTLVTASNLAIVVSARNYHADAQAIFKRVLENQQQTLDAERKSTKVAGESEPTPTRPMHPETFLDTIYNIGLMSWYIGRSGEAEPMFRRALAGYEEIYGPESTKTLSALFVLGKVLDENGKIGDGEAFILKALEGSKVSPGPASLFTLLLFRNLGDTYFAQLRLTEAEAMYLQALTGYEHNFGLNYYLTIEAARALSKVYRGLGRLEEARATKERYKQISHVGLDIICDICNRTLGLAEYYHHCEICNGDDFDICEECISDGSYCLDDTHKLTELRVGRGQEESLMIESGRQAEKPHGTRGHRYLKSWKLLC